MILHNGKREEIDPDIAEQVRDANISYHDAIAEEYESHPSTALVFGKRAQTRINGVIQFLSQNTKGGLFIDIGCGTGNVLKFAQKAFHQAMGVDISVGMLSVAKNRGLNVCLADAITLPIESSAVDAISCFSVLHHLYQQKPFFLEFFRVLKPGGYLYTDFDPNGISLLRRPFVLSLVRYLYNGFLFVRFGRLIGKGLESENSKMLALQKLAEYHQNYSSGLKPEAIRQELKSIGFREINIYFHFSTLSLNRYKCIPIPVAARAFVSPFLAIIAKK
jgi:ubiquinone/menaquinone biosynthesis C-methylase UbiE